MDALQDLEQIKEEEQAAQKEMKEKSVTIRKLGSEKQEKISLEKAMNKIKLLNKLPI